MKTLVSDLSTICERYRIGALYLFGSRAEEMRDKLLAQAPVAASPASDADVGVLPEKRIHLSHQDRVRLMADLEDLLDVGRVDLVVLPETSAFLAVEVISGEIVYDRNPDQTARYELYVLRRAGDLLPFERERVRMILREGAA
ncbi:MAG: nucleotidyltransferase domain-containing protein [Nitrospirae bacterium]|nr:nucleotidyltransferase domain-containing protein [Nitrospirota bacterium]